MHADADLVGPRGRPVPELYQQSFALESSYSNDRALQRLDGIPAVGEDAYLVPLRKGWLLYLLGRYDDAVASYQVAITADATAVEPRLGQTLPLMALRRWAEAEKALRWVLDKEPGNYTARSRLGYVLYSGGRHAEAVYSALVAAYPSDLEMRAGLGWAELKQGKTDAARKDFQYVLHLMPDHASAKEGLAAIP